MVPYLGDFVEDAIVYIMFNTFTSDDPSASCTITNFINTDVHIHKNDGLTQRNNAAGITVSVDFDGITGSHMIKIDTSDDTVAGFWVAGADYFVRIEGTTVDGATVNVVVGHFSIENRFQEVDVVKWLGTAAATPTVAGVPEVDVTHLGGVAQSLLDLKDFADAGYDPATNKVQGVVLADTVTALTGHTAQTGDSFARLGAPAGASIAADLVTIDNFVDDLESRLTVTRAGYLDELAAANLPADVDTLLTRLTTTRAGYLDYLFSIYFGLVSSVAQAQGGAAGSITLNASASAVNDFYKGQIIVVYTGTGAGQARACYAYDGGTKVASTRPNWATAPDATSWYVIIAAGSAVVAAIEDIDFGATMKASINTECDTALTDYDPPTRAELTTDKNSIITEVNANETKIDALNDLSAAQVNAEVVDALNIDTYGEPGQEAPAATTTLVNKIGYIYKFLRNKLTNDGTTIKVYNDAGGVVDQKSTCSEAAGTVTRGKFGTGP